MTPPPADHDPDETGTRRVDRLLVEGLGRLDAGDSAGWRRLVQEHPDHAAELQRQVRRLQEHGFYTGTAAPARCGDYLLGHKLGQGGMGIVYRARRIGDGREVAVKLVRPEHLDGEAARRRFCREVTAVQALAHPGIVEILDVGIDDELPWFAMELVAGSSLSDRIHEAREAGADATAARRLGARTPASNAWFWFVVETLAQVLDALQYAHSRGVLHRDVKPSNILVGDDGRAVLIDFGLAHVDAATTITRTGETLGSLPYMPPELLRHRGAPSVASDVYSAGASLHHALALQLPFAGANAEGIRHGILHGEARPLSSLDPTLPAAIDVVCRRAMAPEPHHRYATAAEFAADLRAVLEGRPTAARLPGPLLRTRRWIRRNPVPALALAAVAGFGTLLPASLLLVQARELHRTQRLSDLHLVGELLQAERELWPARPEVVTRPEGMAHWLAQAEELLGRRTQHETDLAAVRRRGRPYTGDERLASDAVQKLQREIDALRSSMHEARTARPPSWEDWLAELQEHEAPLRRRLEEVEAWWFEDAADARLHRNLANLLLGLDRLDEQRLRIAERTVRAAALHDTSLAAAATAWRATLAEIADRERNPRYRGLRMPPQFGLLPLGRDPQSGLFEFAHLPSGAAPTRGADGRIRIAEEHGIVLVLLPGGLVRVGADLDPAGPHFDPGAAAGDAPSVLVRLDPFFIGKFEVTQAQWVRQRGHNNCLVKPGPLPMADAAPVTGAHPVDVVSWPEARRILHQWGLVLPTGAQWEYAARAGTTGPTWCGGGPEGLDGVEALHDTRTAETAWRPAGHLGHLQPRDAWPVHAPVGSLRPNPFGLFDMLGNVAEFTLDAPRPYRDGLREGDGRTGNVDAGSVRGGAFNTLPGDCRVERRAGITHDGPAAGVRAVRRIEGEWTQESGA